MCKLLLPDILTCTNNKVKDFQHPRNIAECFLITTYHILAAAVKYISVVFLTGDILVLQ